MQDLIEYIVKSITGDDSISVKRVDEEDREIYEINAGKENIGRIIGKGGSVIRAIRNIVKAKAILEKKSVFVNVSEKE